MIYGVVTSQWVLDPSGDKVPRVWQIFGSVISLTDVTGESTDTVLSAPNFVNNGIWATQAVWDAIDLDLGVLIQYYG